MKTEPFLQDSLRLLGLSEYELKVYATACELGSGSASLLAKRAHIPRSSIYPVLEALSQKGLISVEQGRSTKIFIPAGPQALVSLAEEEVDRAQASLSAAKHVAEILSSERARRAAAKAKILVFEGKRSVEQMLYDWEDECFRSSLERNSNLVGFQDSSFVNNYGVWILHNWKKANAQKHLKDYKVRLFVPNSNDMQLHEAAARLSAGRRQLKLLPSTFSFSATVWVVGDFIVAIKTEHDPHYGLLIHDRVLAENLGSFFQAVWEITTTSTHGK